MGRRVQGRLMSAATAATETTATVRLAGPEDGTRWKRFLAESGNGTLFHDLDFLAYHPSERFCRCDLLVTRGDRLVSVLPAGLAEDECGRILRSPVGASVGGFVLSARAPLQAAQESIRAVQDYARREGIARVEVTVGPSAYAQPGNDLVGFALAAAGFRLAQRWLNPMVPLQPDPGLALSLLPSKRRQSYIRAALKEGVEVVQEGPALLPAFHEILVENRAKHEAKPTHTLAELERIFALVPGRVRLFVCRRGAELLGGTVVFELNAHVAYSFCPAHLERHEPFRPAAVLLYRLIQEYGARGFRHLDLGPTGNVRCGDGAVTLNAGNARFKEEMGGVAFNRDCWIWIPMEECDGPRS